MKKTPTKKDTYPAFSRWLTKSLEHSAITEAHIKVIPRCCIEEALDRFVLNHPPEAVEWKDDGQYVTMETLFHTVKKDGIPHCS